MFQTDSSLMISDGAASQGGAVTLPYTSQCVKNSLRLSPPPAQPDTREEEQRDENTQRFDITRRTEVKSVTTDGSNPLLCVCAAPSSDSVYNVTL